MKAMVAPAAIIICSAVTLSAAERNKQQKDHQFKQLDKNGDGSISIQECMTLRALPPRNCVGVALVMARNARVKAL
jgi:hypothetical protein